MVVDINGNGNGVLSCLKIQLHFVFSRLPSIQHNNLWLKKHSILHSTRFLYI